MEMAYCWMICLHYLSSTRIWTHLSAWFVRTLCFSHVLSAYVLLRESVWRLLSVSVGNSWDGERDSHFSFFCCLLEKCLLRSLVVVRVCSLLLCTLDALAAWLREQLWLVKLAENHNRIYRKVLVMLQGCRDCCVDWSFKKMIRSQWEHLQPFLKLVFIAQ